MLIDEFDEFDEIGFIRGVKMIKFGGGFEHGGQVGTGHIACLYALRALSLFY